MAKKAPVVNNDLLIAQLLDTGFSVSSIVTANKIVEAVAAVAEVLAPNGLSPAQVHFMGPHARELKGDLMRMLIRNEISSFKLQCEVGKPLLVQIGSKSFESIRDAQTFLGKVSRNEVAI